jgi:hypothetical protein
MTLLIAREDVIVLIIFIFIIINNILSFVLGGVMVSVFTVGLKVRGLKHDRGQWIFKGDKSLQQAFLRRGNKESA